MRQNGLFTSYSKNSIDRLIFTDYKGVLILKAFLHDCIIHKNTGTLNCRLNYIFFELYIFILLLFNVCLFQAMNLPTFNGNFLREISISFYCIYNQPYP